MKKQQQKTCKINERNYTYESKVSCAFGAVIKLEVLLLEPAFNLPIFMCIRPMVV